MKNKTKALKKKEEKERKTKGKTQGEDLKEPLADNDDSSSTTTETSNPDMEANIKEVHTRETNVQIPKQTCSKMYILNALFDYNLLH